MPAMYGSGIDCCIDPVRNVLTLKRGDVALDITATDAADGKWHNKYADAFPAKEKAAP